MPAGRQPAYERYRVGTPPRRCLFPPPSGFAATFGEHIASGTEYRWGWPVTDLTYGSMASHHRCVTQPDADLRTAVLSPFAVFTVRRVTTPLASFPNSKMLGVGLKAP